MKLYSLYTNHHKVFKDDWFLPTLKDSFEIVIKEYQQEGEGVIGSDLFYNAMLLKVETIIQALIESPDEVILYADIDIQFFRPIKSIITDLIQEYDMLIQKDSPYGVFCAGLMAIRSNANTLKLFKDIIQIMKKRKTHDDQQILNELLFYNQIENSQIVRLSVALKRRWNKLISTVLGAQDQSAKLFATLPNPYNIKVNHFPDSFYSGGTLTSEIWEPGKELPIPDDIILHHANWTKGVENKIKQLQYVKKKVASIRNNP